MNEGQSECDSDTAVEASNRGGDSLSKLSVGEDDRSGGSHDDSAIVTANSITQRCRAREAWAASENFPAGKDNWVCQNPHCRRPVCAAVFGYESAVSDLESAVSGLESAISGLESAVSGLEEARGELQKQRDRLANSQGASDPGTLDLMKEVVKDKETIVKDKETIVKKQETIVKDKETIVKKQETIVTKVCLVLTKEHEGMKEVLINGKAAGNKTDHKTLYTNKSELGAAVAKMDAAESADNNKVSPSKLHGAMHARHLQNRSPLTLDEVFSKLSTDPTDKRKEHMQEFYKYCDALFYKSKESRHAYNSKKYAQGIQRTVTAIAEWTPQTKHTRESYFRPSAVAQETRGVHPILLTLMWKINSILKGTAHLTSEQFLKKQIEKSKRWMDALFSSHAQHFLSSANGNLIGKSCEFKPISRKGDGHHKMVSEGLNQEMGHNLQVLWDSCFQFCRGLGRDGEAAGIVLTMISASLSHAKLSGVGTQSMVLQIQNTAILPLFSSKTTTKLANCKNLKELDLEPFSDEPMQPGFVELINFMLTEGNEQTPQDTVVLSIDDDSISIDNIDYLGSGAFSSVYECRIGDQHKAALKLSKYGNVEALERELFALKELSGHDAIPTLFRDELVEVTVKARCEKNLAPGLLLTVPKGIPLSQKPSCIRVQEMLEVIASGLEYAHEKSWFHLDVQPSNIVVVVNPVDDTHRYILIDWGTAVNGDKRLTKFHGTPPFTHPHMFLVKEGQDDKWEGPGPSGMFDKFSLAMTIAYILHGGVPWSGFHNKVVTNVMLEYRNKKAASLITESNGLDDNWKKKLREWISDPDKPSPSEQKTSTPAMISETTSQRGRKRSKPMT